MGSFTHSSTHFHPLYPGPGFLAHVPARPCSLVAAWRCSGPHADVVCAIETFDTQSTEDEYLLLAPASPPLPYSFSCIPAKGTRT